MEDVSNVRLNLLNDQCGIFTEKAFESSRRIFHIFTKRFKNASMNFHLTHANVANSTYNCFSSNTGMYKMAVISLILQLDVLQ